MFRRMEASRLGVDSYQHVMPARRSSPHHDLPAMNSPPQHDLPARHSLNHGLPAVQSYNPVLVSEVLVKERNVDNFPHGDLIGVVKSKKSKKRNQHDWKCTDVLLRMETKLTSMDIEMKLMNSKYLTMETLLIEIAKVLFEPLMHSIFTI